LGDLARVRFELIRIRYNPHSRPYDEIGACQPPVHRPENVDVLGYDPHLFPAFTERAVGHIRVFRLQPTTRKRNLALVLGHVHRAYVKDDVPVVVVVVERYEHASRGRVVTSLGDWIVVGKR
jgi:hypothetical protein